MNGKVKMDLKGIEGDRLNTTGGRSDDHDIVIKFPIPVRCGWDGSPTEGGKHAGNERVEICVASN